MILAICIDDKNGISFNKRRQSRDSLLIKDLMETAGERKVFISSYSLSLFSGYEDRITVDNSFIDSAGDEDICFVEVTDPSSFIDRINGIILYRWNRHYPSDKKLTLDMSAFKLDSTEEFRGSSHELITREVYVR